MTKVKSELKIGLVGIIAIFILVWGINFLKGNNIFGDSNKYYAIYSNIDGLESSSPVRAPPVSV